MKRIAVIGAGIVGLTTAYELTNQGFEVSVYEAKYQPGQKASKANGAQLSYSFVTPLANPDTFRSLHKLLADRAGALRFRPRLDISQLQWLLTFISSCSAKKSYRSAQDLLQLGILSRQALADFLVKFPMEFSYRKSGKLQVFRSDRVFKKSVECQTNFLRTNGVEHRTLSVDETLELEPTLAPIRKSISGSLFTPYEASGDCELLCLNMCRLLDSLGVSVQFGKRVTSLRRERGHKVSAFIKDNRIDADAIVLANGLGAQELIKNLRINLGIHSLRGYSLTYPVNSNSGAPSVSVSDIRNKTVYARLGDQLRVAGMIDIGVRSPREMDERIQMLKDSVHDFYPEFSPTDAPKVWTGERPARASSMPIISRCGSRNLFINAGQGALGFTLAFGSARLLADSVIGQAANYQGLAGRFIN